MQKIKRQNGQVVSGQRGAEQPLPSIEELKTDFSSLLGPEVAPLSTREVMELIGCVRASEQLRLHVPQSIGGRQDYFVVGQLLARTKQSDLGDKLLEQLDEGHLEVSEDAKALMKEALHKERELLTLANEMMHALGNIHNRIVGSREG